MAQPAGCTCLCRKYEPSCLGVCSCRPISAAPLGASAGARPGSRAALLAGSAGPAYPASRPPRSGPTPPHMKTEPQSAGYGNNSSTHDTDDQPMYDDDTYNDTGMDNDTYGGDDDHGVQATPQDAMMKEEPAVEASQEPKKPLGVGAIVAERGTAVTAGWASMYEAAASAAAEEYGPGGAPIDAVSAGANSTPPSSGPQVRKANALCTLWMLQADAVSGARACVCVIRKGEQKMCVCVCVCVCV